MDNAVTVTYADGSLAELPCPQAKWMNLWKSGWQYGSNQPPPDTFTVTFATVTTNCGPGGCIEASGLTPQSSGKLISSMLVMDPGTPHGACPTNRYIRYPQGWQMTTQGKRRIVLHNLGPGYVHLFKRRVPQEYPLILFCTGRGHSVTG